MPRDVSLSDSKCLNGGHEWVNEMTHSIRTQANEHILPTIFHDGRFCFQVKKVYLPGIISNINILIKKYYLISIDKKKV